MREHLSPLTKIYVIFRVNQQELTSVITTNRGKGKGIYFILKNERAKKESRGCMNVRIEEFL